MCASDGAGLACGLFTYLLDLGIHRPKVLAATHFHEIFESGFLKHREALEFSHMEIRVDETAEEIEDKITYLYKLGSLRRVSGWFWSVNLANNFLRQSPTRTQQH